MGSEYSIFDQRKLPLSLIISLRLLGGLLFCLSIAELGVGGTAFGMFTNVKVGAWWGAILRFVLLNIVGTVI